MTPAENQPATRAAGERGTGNRILQAALEIFAERGFDGARTREIAERAGANLGLINYYFGSKEELWRAAVERAFAQLSDDFADVLEQHADADDRTQLERLLRRFVHFAARHPEFIRLMNDEGKRDSPRMRWLADRFVKPMFQLLAERVEHADVPGAARGVPPLSLHYIAVGAAGLLFSQAPECLRVTGIDPTSPEVVEAHADAVVRLVLGS